jgi:hypothetical protein
MCLAKAFALIVGPILLGAVFLLATAPPKAPGVYVEVADVVYHLVPCGMSDAGTLSANAPAYRGIVQSFFVVFPDPPQAPLPANWAQLYFTVVDHAQPEADFGRHALATDIRSMSPRIHRVVSGQALRWEFGALAESVYRQSLARHVGNRATTELLLELEFTAFPGDRKCRHAVVLGPPPDQPDSSFGWFVPPAGEHR